MIQGDYRWYSIKAGGRQSDGIFVDSSDRILYWPNKKAPAYIIDDVAATEIQNINCSDANKKGAYSILITLAALLVRMVYHNHGLHEQFRLLTGNLSIFPATLLTILLTGIIIGLPAKQFQRKEIASILKKYPTVDVSRPKPEFLKPSEARLKPSNPSVARKILVYLIVIIVGGMGVIKGMLSPLWGDRIFTVLISILAIWIWFRSKEMETDGLRKEDVVIFKK